MMGDTAEIEVVGKLESDGLALTHARWRVGEMSGYGTIVSRRQPDGSWLIALDNPLSVARDDPHDRHFLTRVRVGIGDVDARSSRRTTTPPPRRRRCPPA